jgi:hypothetical protein
VHPEGWTDNSCDPFKGHKLTIGMDLGDRWSCHCVLDEAGKIILEQKVAMTPEAMKQTFSKIPQGLIAMETGTHSRPFRKREGTRASLLEKSPESRTTNRSEQLRRRIRFAF